MCETHKKPVSLPQAMKRVHDNNVEYCEKTPQEYFDEVQQGQTPWVGVIDCSDSRVTIDSIVGVKGRLGQAFNYSCAGSLPDGGRGSLEIAIDHLGVKLIIVEGHTECLMVITALGDFSNEREALQKDAKLVKSRIDAIGADYELSRLDNLTQKILRNTFAQAQVVCSWFEKEVAEGSIVVVSSLYDLHNKIGQGKGRQYTYAINDETNLFKLMSNPILAKMSKQDVAESLIKTYLPK